VSNEHDQTVERVMRIVAEETGWNRLAIREDAEIEGDLGCSGDRARELLLRIERELGVDLHAIDFDRHFDNETGRGWPVAVSFVVALPTSVLAMHAIGALVRLTGSEGSAVLASTTFFAFVYVACGLSIALLTRLVPRLKRRRRDKLPVTVRHLIDAARTGKWPFASHKGQSQ
jgi:hypothetical protein